MPGKPEAPIDSLTHFPLPFVPDPDLPPVPEWGTAEYNTYDRRINSFHHPNFEHEELERMGHGGQAVRDSRVQWTWTDWHDWFHQEYGGLTIHMPRTEKAQYNHSLLGALDYIPRQAIDFSGPSPQIVTLSRWQMELARAQIRVGRNGERIRRFWLEFAVAHGGPQVNPEVVNAFLWLAKRRDSRESRMWELAGTILNQSIDPIVTPGLRQIYDYSRHHELVRPNLPQSLGSLIHREIVAYFPTSQGFVRSVAQRFSALRQAHPQAV